MHVGLIDVVDWQTTVDFSDGRPVECSHPRAELCKAMLARHPYPGDLSGAGSQWVTDTALDLVQLYEPRFLMLTYASLFFAAMFSPQGESERLAMVGREFAEIQRFLDHSDYVPVVVGLGDLGPARGTVDVMHLDGEVVAGGMSPRFAGLFRPSAADLATLESHPGVERIVDRESFRAQFGGEECFYQRFPEYLIAAREGFVFRGVGNSARPLYHTPRHAPRIPLHSPLGSVSSLTDVAGLVLQGLRNEQVALIVVEGVGCDLFPWQCTTISNALHWFCYAVGEGQYLALTTGRHLVEWPYPPGYRYYVDDDERKRYPFSGIMGAMPTGTIAQQCGQRSAAVGNRSILTHVAAGADITIECLARTLYNHGVMALVQVDGFSQE